MKLPVYKKTESFRESWEVKRLIGQGSIGRVFEIEREEAGRKRRAAMKLITVPRSESELKSLFTDGMDGKNAAAYYRHFAKEMADVCKIMAGLKACDNLVQCEEHAILPHPDGIGRDILIRMELLTPFSDFMAGEEEMKREDVIELGIDICRALECLQKRNMVHGDIKPENIFFSYGGDCKLGDCGLARAAERYAGVLPGNGTYLYMAPEVYKGEKYGIDADIYSLGLVLYCLLNGNRLPFLTERAALVTHGDREGAIAKRVRGQPFPLPAEAADELGEIVLKACACAPGDRYGSPEDFRVALERIRNGISGKATETDRDAGIQPDGGWTARGNEGTETTAVSGLSVKKTPDDPGQAGSDPDTRYDREGQAENTSRGQTGREGQAVTVSGMESDFSENVEDISLEPTDAVVLPGPESVNDSQDQGPGKPKKRKWLFIGIGVAAALITGMLVMTAAEIVGDRFIPESFDHVLSFLFGMIAHEEAGADGDTDTGTDNAGMNGIGAKDASTAGLLLETPVLYGRYRAEGYAGTDIPDDFLTGMEYRELDGLRVSVLPLQISCQPDVTENGGSGDRAELTFATEDGLVYKLAGHYKAEGSDMSFTYPYTDDGGEPGMGTMEFAVRFSGVGLEVSGSGISRTLLPQKSADGIHGYASSGELYEGLYRIYFSEADSQDLYAGFIYENGDWAADPSVIFTGENTVTVSWKEKWTNRSGVTEKVSDPVTLSFGYLKCPFYGFVLYADGKNYYYQKSEKDIHTCL